MKNNLKSVKTGIHIIRRAAPVVDQAQKADAGANDSDKSRKTDPCKGREQFHVPSVLVRPCSSFPRLRRVLWEFRSFRNRIRTVWSNNDSYRCSSSFAYLEAPSGSVYENTRSNGRIECIRTCVSRNPWATPLDWKMCSDAWDQGVEWALRNLDFDSSSTSEHKEVLKSELSYKGPRQK